MNSNDITVEVHSISGQVFSINTNHDATLGDVKEMVRNQLGHSCWSQRLSLGTTLLTDSSKSLKELGIVDASVLSLVVILEPIGQSTRTRPHGRLKHILDSNEEYCLDYHSAQEVLQYMLDDFQLMSLNLALSFFDEGSWDKSCPFGRYIEKFGIPLKEELSHLFWTTRSDGCRYEYWSFGDDDDYGLLVRIDSETMTVIGRGSKDGLEVFEEFRSGDVIQDLVREGWYCWGEVEA